MRGVIRRFGMPDAISWPVFWVTYLSAFIGNFVSNAGAVPLLTRVLILLIASIPMWAVLLLARLLFFRDPQRSRPVIMAIVLVVSVLLRASSVGGLFGLLLGPTEAKLEVRLVGALINVGLAYVLAANVVVLFRERRREISMLESQRRRMDASVEQVSSGIEERNEQTIERVRTVLVQELSALEGASADESLTLLQATASDVVRPMSHELAHAVPKVDPELTSIEPTTVAWPEVIDRAASGRPFSPWIVALLIAIESLSAALLDPQGILAFGIVSMALVLLLAVANRILGVLLPGKSRRVRIVLVVVFALLVGFMVMLIQVLLRGTGSLNLAIGIALGCFAVAFSLGTAVVRALVRDRDRVIVELQESSRQLEHGLVRLRQAQWFQQKALSRALHGPIQTAVTAAAIKLDSAIQEGRVQPGLVDSVRAELLAGLDVLHEADTEVATIERCVERMRATWEGVCSIESEVSAAADSALSADGVLRSCVIDLVTEAVSNAVWHGKADLAWIVIGLDPEAVDVLRVEVSSNGRGSADSERRGLGSQQLDDWTLAWSREIGGAGTRLSATLPVVASGV